LVVAFSCLRRTVWKLLEDKQFSALADDALSVICFPCEVAQWCNWA
jgi:hypothetical protein